MKKHKLYRKTKRYNPNDRTVLITEKIDGSNLCIGVKNMELYIFQRNYYFKLSELETVKNGNTSPYGNLIPWLEKHGEWLKENIYEGSVIMGEWLGMGSNIDYNYEEEFVIFGKGRLTDSLQIEKREYRPSYLHYIFKEQTIPEFIKLVPFVETLNGLPTITQLDSIYHNYCQSVAPRNVEGFIMNVDNEVNKYVRYKHGKLEDHSY